MNKKKLRYAILKSLDDGSISLEDYKKYEIELKTWEEQIDFLHQEAYISKPMYADNHIYIIDNLRLLEKGEEFLKENSALVKGYNLAKELRDWIK